MRIFKIYQLRRPDKAILLYQPMQAFRYLNLLLTLLAVCNILKFSKE
jgi:hypothetical protein